MTHGGCTLISHQTTEFLLRTPISGVTPQFVHIGNDPSNMALEIACVDVSSSPTRDSLKKIYSERHGNALFPLVVVASSQTTSWILGPNPESPTLELQRDQAQRILQEALNEPNQFAAIQRLAQLRQALQSTDEIGLSNAGLFANHHLKVNVPQSPSWGQACERSRALLPARGRDLIQRLGFIESRAGTEASVLKTNANDRGRAVAILLNEDEQFDALSHRFNLTPIAYGLSVAAKSDVPWLIVLRGSQIRLYPAKDGVGVGQRSQAETYFELDLSLLPDEKVGMLDLIFSATALAVGGSVEELLKGSARFAADLGTRLRNRIYEHVVPDLARGVAGQLPSLGLSVNSENLELAYRLTLRILFRLLFQAYAEDRGLLPYDRNERYTANALKTLVIRDLLPNSEGNFDSASTALWDDLQQVWKVIDGGDSAWNIPAYNGGLFGRDPQRHGEGALISRLSLTNDVMGPALSAMLIDIGSEGVPGPVDFGTLSVREFGTIYEGLLESSLSLADSDLTLDSSGAWVPASNGDEVFAAAGTPYFHNASGERKATGSYFTPSVIVEHLLDKALEPALEQHLDKVSLLLGAGKEADAADTFFDFRVADLAMGSAHFLVAAVDRIETAFRNYLVEHPIPRVRAELARLGEAARTALGSDAEFIGDIDDALLLRRQIARRCIYGIDINEMAVELARLALWIHTFVPGLPMSSLDHGLVCANSLTGIGSIDEALDALDPNAKGDTLFTADIRASLNEAAKFLREAADSDELNKQEIAEARELSLKAKEAAEPIKHVFDAAVAARLKMEQVSPGTYFTVESIVEDGKQDVVIERMMSLQPAHMPYLFPEVFQRENGGFDVLLGNPPWEKVKIEEHQWWSLKLPGLRGMPMAKRDLALSDFKASRPDLVSDYLNEISSVDAMRTVLINGPYPGLGSGGDADLYQAFAWRNWQLSRKAGFLGLLLPRGAHTGSGLRPWRNEILELGTFTDVTFATNTNNWMFENVHGQYTVGMTAIHKQHSGYVYFCGPVYNLSEFQNLNNAIAKIATDEFRSWSNTDAFPLIPDSLAAQIFSQMRKFPAFGLAEQDWEFRPYTELHATNDRKLFDTNLENNKDKIPVIAGASFNIWNINAGDPYGYAEPEQLKQHLTKKISNANKLQRSAFFGMLQQNPGKLPIDSARIAFRDVTNGTNTRTFICCLIPKETTSTHKSPLLIRRGGNQKTEAFLLGILCSIPFDWYMRRWVELHASYELLNATPIPRPQEDNPLRKRVTFLAGSLAASDERFNEWAEEVGVEVASLSSETKFDYICELDALSAMLYGLGETEIQHIFKTFHKGVFDQNRLEKVLFHMRAWAEQK